jgi:hypothetical protein
VGGRDEAAPRAGRGHGRGARPRAGRRCGRSGRLCPNSRVGLAPSASAARDTARHAAVRAAVPAGRAVAQKFTLSTG